MNTQPFSDAPDGETYRSGQDVLNPQRDEQLTEDVISARRPAS